MVVPSPDGRPPPEPARTPNPHAPYPPLATGATPPPPEPAPPAGKSWFHRHPFLTAALAFALALALAWLALRGTHDDGPGPSFLSFDHPFDVPDLDYHAHFTQPGPIHVDLREYHAYLNVSVRPALTVIVTTLAEASCAPQRDAGTLEETLAGVGRFADAALAEARRVVAPPEAEPFHGQLRRVLEATGDTTRLMAECVDGAGARCDEVPQRAADLVGSVGIVIQRAAALPPPL